MMEILKPYVGEIITAIAGFSAWSFERKKRKQEIAKSETENHQSVVDLYQEALDDLKKRYDEKFLELEKDIKKLRDNVNLWKAKYSSLKKEFDDYRAKHEK